MRARLSPLLAAARTELLLRLRSPASAIALAAFAVGAWFWLPPPEGRASSVAWTTLDGRLQAPVYTASYVGFAAAELSAVILSLFGYYLIAGSIRRDRQSGVGAILAASPIGGASYLGAKFLAHAAFLLAVALAGWATTCGLFLLRGVGGFDLGALLLPLVSVALPLALFVAGTTVLFETVPGLRGRGGLVAWFFFFAFGLMTLPALLSGAGGEGRKRALASGVTPLFDPAGVFSLSSLLTVSLPAGVDPTSISSGYIVHETAPERVDWRGISLSGAFLRQRLVTAALALLPLLGATLLFDRFDPARRRGRRGRASKPGPSEISTVGGEADSTGLALESAGSAPTAAKATAAVLPALARAASPSLRRALAAEVRLLWSGASWARWLLLAAAGALALVPATARPLAGSALLVLLAALLGEAAAREESAGTVALVVAQPGMPRFRVLWKAGAMAIFLLLAFLPVAFRLALETPTVLPSLLGAAFWIAALAAGAGALTGGGKLFAALHLTAWYLALNGLQATDWTGLLAGGPDLSGALAVTLLGAALLGLAMRREQVLRRG